MSEKIVVDTSVFITDDKHERLKSFAKSKGISVNKLIEELSTIALAEFDTFTRFKALAATGDAQTGLQILDRLDAETNQIQS